MKRILTFLIIVLTRPVSGQTQTYTICQGSAITLTANSYPGITNVTFSINPGATAQGTPLFNVSPAVSTTYTLYTSGNNGMGTVTYSNIATVNVFGVTSFSLSSAPPNFTLGCGTASMINVAIVNVLTNPPGSAITYTVLPPNAAFPGPGGLGASNGFVIHTPGTHTAIVRNMNGECDSYLPFSVISNTFAPAIDSVSLPRQVLTCDHPTVKLKAFSSHTNISYTWKFPGPGTTTGDTITITANKLAPTGTLTGNFTLQVKDNSSQCITSTVIPIKQNLFPPIAKIGVTGTLTCKTTSLQLTNQSSTGIPLNSGFPTNSMVIGYLWEGTNPPGPISISSTYTAFVSGTYTLTVKDLNNGCLSKATVFVSENRNVPLVNLNTPQPGNICGNILTATLTPVISSNSTNLSYTWTAPPNPTIAAGNSPSFIAAQAGDYTVTVKDNYNGCVTTSVMQVVHCVGMNDRDPGAIKIFPNPAASEIIAKGADGKTLYVLIRDINGRIVLQQEIISGGRINLQALPAGAYIILVQEEAQKTAVKKVIKQ